MNSGNFIGRTVADPELRYTQNGKAVTNFTIAVNRPFDKDKTDFFRVTVWGNQAENCSKYVKKADQIGVTGRVQIEQYETNDGQKRQSVEIVAERVSFVGSGNNSQQNTTQSQQEFTPIADGSEDLSDIPF